jgi:hypothetical protein
LRDRRIDLNSVMPGLVPGIRVLGGRKVVDGRVKPGHDGQNLRHHPIADDMIALC